MKFGTFCDNIIFPFDGQLRLYINKECVPRVWIGIKHLFSLGINDKYKDYEIKEMCIHFKGNSVIYIFKLRG